MRVINITVAGMVGAAAVVMTPHMAVAQTGHSISGAFTNNCGDGSGGAWVTVRDSGAVEVASAFIGDGGTFSFDDLPDGQYTVAPYAPQGCGPIPYPSGRQVTVDGLDVTGADVEIVTVHSIWGRVTGCEAGEGEGVNGVRVDLAIDTDELAYQASYTSRSISEDGQFFFQYLPAFDGYTLTVTPPEGCLIEDPTVDVDLSEGGADVEFALEQIPDPAPGPVGSLGSLVGPGSLGGSGSLGSSELPGGSGSLGSSGGFGSHAFWSIGS